LGVSGIEQVEDPYRGGEQRVDGWSIDLSPDQRSAFVNFVPGEKPCATG
jgi:hypothetical protein